MSGVLDLLTSRAPTAALVAGLVWLPLTAFPTCSAPSRGRMASTVAISLGVCCFVFVQRLTAPAAA